MSQEKSSSLLDIISIIEHEKEFPVLLRRFATYVSQKVLNDPGMSLSVFNISKSHDRITLRYRYSENRIFGHPDPDSDESSVIALADQEIHNIRFPDPTSCSWLIPSTIKGKLSGFFLLRSPSHKIVKNRMEDLEILFYILKNEYYIFNILYLVRQDELTGLLNKRCLLDRLSKGYEQCIKDKSPIGMAIIDIDKFKHYNDTYGHNTGDYILKSISKLLMNLGKTLGYTSYRYGGEELVLIFEGKTSDIIHTEMEKVRIAVMESNHSTEEWFLKLTVSCGIADNSTNSSFMEMFEQADKALYYSKKNGRNRVTTFSKNLLS